MSDRSYYAPKGGLPPQTQLLTDRAMFTEAYAVIPKGTATSVASKKPVNTVRIEVMICA